MMTSETVSGKNSNRETRETHERRARSWRKTNPIRLNGSQTFPISAFILLFSRLALPNGRACPAERKGQVRGSRPFPDDLERVQWLDTHVHVSDLGPSGPRPDLLGDLLRVLDTGGEDLRFVISPDAQWNTIVKTESDGVRRANAFIHDLVARAPDRLYGSCLVNPRFLDESLRAMDRCFGQWGFVQLGEMLQYMMAYDMDTDAVEALVRKAVEYGVPVQVHISTSNSPRQGHTSGMGELRDLFGIAERVASASYILAHLVGMPDDNPPVVDAYLDAIDARYGAWPEMFWAEIRDFDSPGVRSALERIPGDRLLAGTDWCSRIGPPFLPYGTIFGDSAPVARADRSPVAGLVADLREAGAGDGLIRRIGFDNGAELLRIAV